MHGLGHMASGYPAVAVPILAAYLQKTKPIRTHGWITPALPEPGLFCDREWPALTKHTASLQGYCSYCQ
jgi:hypothetical protein